VLQEDEQLKRLVMINGAMRWSVVAEKIKVRRKQAARSTSPSLWADALTILVFLHAGSLRKVLPFEVSASGHIRAWQA
jgi:hypothetical protein